MCGCGGGGGSVLLRDSSLDDVRSIAFEPHATCTHRVFLRHCKCTAPASTLVAVRRRSRALRFLGGAGLAGANDRKQKLSDSPKKNTKSQTARENRQRHAPQTGSPFCKGTPRLRHRKATESERRIAEASWSCPEGLTRCQTVLHKRICWKRACCPDEVGIPEVANVLLLGALLHAANLQTKLTKKMSEKPRLCGLVLAGVSLEQRT